MRCPRRPRLLLFAVAAIAIMGSAALTAAAYPSAPLQPLNPWASTGTTDAHASPTKELNANTRRRLRGLRGVAGKTGAAGPVGATGTAGPVGATGAAGSQGTQGTQGTQGLQGIQGTPGTDGEQGIPGSVGPAQYAYIYNLSAQTVPLSADVTFDSNGALTAGITHAAGTAGVTLVGAGVYKVTFSVSAVGLSQMALFVGGTLVPGTTYGSGAGTQQNTGHAIFTVSAGSVLTLRNHTSAAATGLETLSGGSQVTTNASLVIEKLA